MHVTFWAADKEREYDLASAFAAGCGQHGDTLEVRLTGGYEGPDPGCDVGVFWGVKSQGARMLREHVQQGFRCVMLDKGHMGGPAAGRAAYVRASLDAFMPTAYFQDRPRPADRWDRLGVRLLERQPREIEAPVIFAGSSQKYCDFHDLGDATTYAKKIIRRIRGQTRRPVIYRPKPSWGDAMPIRDTRLSGPDERLADLLGQAFCLVTHGSNAALEALAAGVPAIVLGPGLASVLCARDVEAVRSPPFPEPGPLRQFFADMAYCQWTLDEYRSGDAWAHLRELILR